MDGNESIISSMLSVSGDATGADLVQKLREVMHVNSISVEMLLARFFSTELLSTYCARLDVSGKGSEPVLAARILKKWNSPTFQVPAGADANPRDKKRQKVSGTGAEETEKEENGSAVVAADAVGPKAVQDTAASLEPPAGYFFHAAGMPDMDDVQADPGSLRICLPLGFAIEFSRRGSCLQRDSSRE